MEQLNALGNKKIDELASRYRLSVESIHVLLNAVRQGYGTQAQFSHPELGGMGQWMKGGMIMIGDMFNNSLKATVSDVCYQLSDMLMEPSYWLPRPETNSNSSNVYANQNWWPAAYGQADAVGAQNEFAYALFGSRRRMAVKQHEKVTLYDTLGYSIYGFSQQQGGGEPELKISTNQGEIRLRDLKVVEE